MNAEQAKEKLDNFINESVKQHILNLEKALKESNARPLTKDEIALMESVYKRGVQDGILYLNKLSKGNTWAT